MEKQRKRNKWIRDDEKIHENYSNVYCFAIPLRRCLVLMSDIPYADEASQCIEPHIRMFLFQHESRSHWVGIKFLQQAKASHGSFRWRWVRFQESRQSNDPCNQRDGTMEWHKRPPLNNRGHFTPGFLQLSHPGSAVQLRVFRFRSKRLTADNTENKSHRFLLQR